MGTLIFQSLKAYISSMRYLLLFVISPILCISMHAHANLLQPLDEQSLKYAKAAFAALDKEKWEKAYTLAVKSNVNEVKTLVTWEYLRNHPNTVDFLTPASFINQFPEFPSIKQIQRFTEGLITTKTDTTLLLKWFESNPPITSDAKALYARLLLNTEAAPRAKIRKLVKASWVRGNRSKKEAQAFLREFRSFISQKDHHQLVNRLLWEDRITLAKMHLHRLSKPQYKLAKARIFLKKNTPGVDKAVAHVPPALSKHPALLYDRILYRKRHNNLQGAVALFKQVEPNPPMLHKWWNIRHRLIRTALSKKRYKTAYLLASSHRQTSGYRYADAEWLSGWIALRFLDQPLRAYRHFQNLLRGVKYPISIARASYWSARAAESMHRSLLSQYWYYEALEYPTTFYGQLAQLDENQNLPPLTHYLSPQLPTPFTPKSDPLLPYLAITLQAGNTALSKPLAHKLINNAHTLAELQQILQMATVHNNTHIAYITAKRIAKTYPHAPLELYPKLHKIPPYIVDPALTHAIIRQESAFYPAAISHAGARGLMQLMPDTARDMARKLKVRYDSKKLVAHPHYNIQLGDAYLSHLLTYYNQSYILAIAAYNGGPGNVNKWIKQLGDPRKISDTHEIVDWIEMIPFNETRNYVQRVLEGMHLYQAVLHPEKQQIAFRF